MNDNDYIQRMIHAGADGYVTGVRVMVLIFAFIFFMGGVADVESKIWGHGTPYFTTALVIIVPPLMVVSAAAGGFGKLLKFFLLLSLGLAVVVVPILGLMTLLR